MEFNTDKGIIKNTDINNNSNNNHSEAMRGTNLEIGQRNYVPIGRFLPDSFTCNAVVIIVPLRIHIKQLPPLVGGQRFTKSLQRNILRE